MIPDELVISIGERIRSNVNSFGIAWFTELAVCSYLRFPSPPLPSHVDTLLTISISTVHILLPSFGNVYIVYLSVQSKYWCPVILLLHFTAHTIVTIVFD